MPERIPRPEFITTRFNYVPGEHVTFIEPTQGGKTTLAFQLLAHVTHTELAAIVLEHKPADPTVTRLAALARFGISRSWPPGYRNRSDPGWVLWPRQSLTDRDADRKLLESEFRKGFNSWYTGQLPGRRELTGVILLVDDTLYASGTLNMRDDLETGWTMGASGGHGLWSAWQKPSGTTIAGGINHLALNSPRHLFLGRDPDLANRRRFGEIGGIDPRQVSEAVASLTGFEKLYLHKSGAGSVEWCIVGA